MTSCASKTSYRVIALLLVCCLFLGFSAAPDANAEIALTTAVVIGVGVAALAAYGVTLIQSNHTNQSYSDFIGGKMQDYCDIHHDGASFVDVFGTGVTAGARGFILPALVALNLTKFIDWFIDEEGLTSDSKTISTSVGGLPVGRYSGSTLTENPPLIGHALDYTSSNPFQFSIGSVSLTIYSSTNTSFRFSSGSKGGSIDYGVEVNNTQGYKRAGFGFAINGSYINPCYYSFDSSSASWKWHLKTGSNFSIPISGSASTVSGSYTPVFPYPITDTAVVPSRPFNLNLTNTASGDSPDPELDPNDLLASAAATALALALANSLSTTMVEDLTHQEGGGEVVDPTDPDSDDSFIRNALTAISTTLESFGDWISDAASDVVDAVGTLADKLAEWFGSVLEAVQALGLSIADFFSDFWDNFTDRIKEAIHPAPTVPWGESLSGFGSIWHYVVEWLGYIGGFITLILSVWNHLPYAMVVPVYACITLILIFGVYRKFIS